MLVSVSPSNLRDAPGAEGGFGSLENQPRGPVEVGGCRAPGWVRDHTEAKDWQSICMDAPMKSWEVVGRGNVGPWEWLRKLLLLLNSGEMRDLRQNDACMDGG